MKWASALVLAVAITACSAPQVAAPESSVDAASSRAGPELFAYLARLGAMSGERRSAEAARQRGIAAPGAPGDVARVKAALAMSLAPEADDAEILALVQPVAGRRGDAPEVIAMASFLQAMAHDRRRLRESAAAAGTRLRDERRAHETEKQRADALQQRAAQLQQKLDALSQLEKSLSAQQPPSR